MTEAALCDLHTSMRTPVSRRRLRAAALLSPLAAAAILAPSSALAAAPSITINPPSASTVLNTPVTLTASSNDPRGIASWAWDLDGDGLFNDATGATVSPSFNTRGVHTVRVEGTTPATPFIAGDPTAMPPIPDVPAAPGETGGASAAITVNNRAPLTPTVSFTPSTPSAGKPITFSAPTTDPDGDTLRYVWDFGGGDVVTNAGPTIIHSLPPGVATVFATVEDGFGGTASANTGAFLVVNQPPRAKLTVSPNPVGVGKAVTLSGTGSSDPEGGPLSFSWDLGLGSFGAFSPNPMTTTTFLTPGVKTVQLNVKDQFGAVDPGPDSVTVTVSARQPPAPNFEFSPVNPTTADQVTFSSTTAAGEQPVKSLDWDLDGDGTFTDAGGTTVVARFTTAGPHTVTLRATDTDGVIATAQKTMNVTAAPGTTPGTATGSGTVETISSSAPINAGTSSTTPPGTTTSSNSKIKAKAALISPFPTVRIRGLIVGSKVKVSLLSVTSKVGVRIKVLCSGKGCPKKAQKKTTRRGGVIRFSALRRTLGNGAVVRVYVSKSGQIGKYTRFRIRKGKAPARTDLCLPASGSSTPEKCPLPT